MARSSNTGNLTGAHIQAFLDTTGMTAMKLSSLLGYSKGHVSHWISGIKPIPEKANEKIDFALACLYRNVTTPPIETRTRGVDLLYAMYFVSVVERYAMEKRGETPKDDPIEPWSTTAERLGNVSNDRQGVIDLVVYAA